MTKPIRSEMYHGLQGKPTDCCPFCKGDSGFELEMTETHVMNGTWGNTPESGSSGHNVKYGAAYCLDCKKKFRCLGDLVKAGLAKFPEGALNV